MTGARQSTGWDGRIEEERDDRIDAGRGAPAHVEAVGGPNADPEGVKELAGRDKAAITRGAISISRHRLEGLMKERVRHTEERSTHWGWANKATCCSPSSSVAVQELAGHFSSTDGEPQTRTTAQGWRPPSQRPTTGIDNRAEEGSVHVSVDIRSESRRRPGSEIPVRQPLLAYPGLGRAPPTAPRRRRGFPTDHWAPRFFVFLRTEDPSSRPGPTRRSRFVFDRWRAKRPCPRPASGAFGSWPRASTTRVTCVPS